MPITKTEIVSFTRESLLGEESEILWWCNGEEKFEGWIAESAEILEFREEVYQANIPSQAYFYRDVSEPVYQVTCNLLNFRMKEREVLHEGSYESCVEYVTKFPGTGTDVWIHTKPVVVTYTLIEPAFMKAKVTFRKGQLPGELKLVDGELDIPVRINGSSDLK
jgi:hypothetical protein